MSALREPSKLSEGSEGAGTLSSWDVQGLRRWGVRTCLCVCVCLHVQLCGFQARGGVEVCIPGSPQSLILALYGGSPVTRPES